MRRLLALGLIALTARTADAQLDRATVLTTPTFTEISFGSGAAKRSVSQMAVPIVVILPFGERFSVDVSTAFANSTVTTGSATTSDISGLTDTQIRANFRLGSDQLLFTVGLNLPTGQYSVPEEQQEAAGQIGNDFLFYPISSMGNGLAGTGGIAYARPAGEWNVGLGASVRKSTEFAAFNVTGTDFRFTPADEYRARISADRPVGDGAVSLGLTYSMFGEDDAEGTTYSTGDRVIASGGWTFPVAGRSVSLSGWNLYRLAGQQFGGDAPPENIFNLGGAVSFETGRLLVQPNAEVRLWQVDGARAGNLINLGVRLRVPAGSFALLPSVGYNIGNIYAIAGSGDATAVRGLSVGVTIRYN